MPVLALLLVLSSSIVHASWNLLLKRSGGQALFVCGIIVSQVALLAPLGGALYWLNPFPPIGWAFIIASGLVHLGYFVLLGRGYSSGDLSLVYPIARGSGSMLVPVLAVTFLQEQVAGLAVAGMAAILTGIFTLSWWGRLGEILRRPGALLRNPALGYALATGGCIAAYSIIDKSGVGYVQPFLYMYLTNAVTAAGLLPYMLLTRGRAAVLDDWRAHPLAIAGAGMLVYVAYCLVLTAFSIARVSYVAPAREIGIVAAALLGVVFLKETMGPGRIAGSALIVAGLTLIALAP